MAYLLGEQIQLGMGLETSRGTAVSPEAWIPARTPAGIISVVDKVPVRETRGSSISSEGAEIVQTRAEGDLEFNVRAETIGYIIKSLLGDSQSTPLGGTAFQHVFTRQTTGAQNPSLTLSLAMPGHQSYEYPLSVVSSLEIRTPVDDLVNATVSFISKSEDDHAAFSPSFSTSDVVFRNHDVTIKFADTVAELDNATGVCVKEFSLNLANNARANQCIGNISPSDIFSLWTEITGSFVADFDGEEDYYDVFKTAGYKAMRIEMRRTDGAPLYVAGSGDDDDVYPTLRIDLHKVSFSGYTQDRPIDDIVTENVEFMGHYKEEDGEAITVTLINEIPDYTPGS